MKEKKPNQYLDNKKFYDCILKYKESIVLSEQNNQPKPIIPNYAGYCIDQIARHMITMPNNRGEPAFTGYTFTEEMISDAIENCILYFDNFDPYKYKNPHAYFSKITYYAFLRRIAKEKKQLYLKYKSALNYGIFNAVGAPDSESESPSFEMFDNLIEFVEKYEMKQKEKTKKVQDVKVIKNKNKANT